MRAQRFLSLLLVLGTLLGGVSWMASQESRPDNPEYRVAVSVDMVQLNVAVTDSKGNYITGLRPSDFAVLEDSIQEQIATFGEENKASRRSADPATTSNPQAKDEAALVPVRSGDASAVPSSVTAGADVFILFDTSNYMYRGFVFAQDAICEFVRSLDHPDRVAFYSYSRDFSRASLLTPDKSRVLRGVRATVVGDDAALYDALLITLKDAAQFSGKRVVVVFSNGPDNASMVAPEDVRELAESEGIPIYMISTQQAKLDPVSTAVFERMSASTGGIPADGLVEKLQAVPGLAAALYDAVHAQFLEAVGLDDLPAARATNDHFEIRPVGAVLDDFKQDARVMRIDGQPGGTEDRSIDTGRKGYSQRVVGGDSNHASLRADEPLKVVGVANGNILIAPLPQQGGLQQPSPGRHVARGTVGVALHVAPVGVFTVQDRLHPDGQRGHRHLNEVARVVNGFGERRRKDDEPAAILGAVDARRPVSSAHGSTRRLAVSAAPEQAKAHSLTPFRIRVDSEAL
jgi:Ca-activated chloride channel homolog